MYTNYTNPSSDEFIRLVQVMNEFLLAEETSQLDALVERTPPDLLDALEDVVECFSDYQKEHGEAEFAEELERRLEELSQINQPVPTRQDEPRFEEKSAQTSPVPDEPVEQVDTEPGQVRSPENVSEPESILPTQEEEEGVTRIGTSEGDDLFRELNDFLIDIYKNNDIMSLFTSLFEADSQNEPVFQVGYSFNKPSAFRDMYLTGEYDATDVRRPDRESYERFMKVGALVEKARRYSRTGQPDKAVEYYQQASHIVVPDDYENYMNIHVNMGYAYVKLGQYV